PGHPPQLTGDLPSLAAQAAELRPNPARADIAAALGVAAQLLNSSRSSDKRLVIVCDRQASSWRDVDSTLATRWRESVRDPQSGRRPRVSLIPVGSTEAGNVAVESVLPLSTPI